MGMKADQILMLVLFGVAMCDSGRGIATVGTRSQALSRAEAAQP